MRFGVGCAAWAWVGAWPASCAGAFILPCFAAAAVPPMRSWVAVPLGLGWALGRVDRLRIRRTSPLFFPLQTIAPSLRGLPAPAGWGSHNPRAVFLYAPVLAIIWGDFGISECPHGPFRRNAARTFPVCTSTGKCLGRFWNIGISARTFPEKTEGRTVRLQCLAGAPHAWSTQSCEPCPGV